MPKSFMHEKSNEQEIKKGAPLIDANKRLEKEKKQINYFWNHSSDILGLENMTFRELSPMEVQTIWLIRMSGSPSGNKNNKATDSNIVLFFSVFSSSTNAKRKYLAY